MIICTGPAHPSLGLPLYRGNISYIKILLNVKYCFILQKITLNLRFKCKSIGHQL